MRRPLASHQNRAPARHFHALDGLRGLAVAGVLLFHAGHLKGGFLGVDLFFVLSGFLITGILIREVRQQGSIGLRTFWIRRSRRLLPALLAVLIGVALYTAVFADAGTLARIRGDALATLFYVANWHSIIAGHSYWEVFSAPSPLEHTWSLAIEEQFYLIWPLVLWGLFRIKGMSLKALLVICLGLAAVSETALWLLYDPVNTSRAYLGTDTRGAAILLGAALATALAIWGPMSGRTSRRVLDLAGGVALVALFAAWSIVGGEDRSLYRGGFLITELLVVTILLCATQYESGLVARFLSLRPFVWLGLISYGVYLWHWPIYVLLNEDRLGFGGWDLTIVRVSLSIAVATLSYALLEMPIRRHGLPVGMPARYVVPGAFVLVLAVIVGSTLGATAPGGGITNADGRVPKAYSIAPAGSAKILVVGDSVAASLGEVMSSVGPQERVAAANGGFTGCSLLSDQLQLRDTAGRASNVGLDCNVAWKLSVASLRPTVSLVLIGGGAKAEAKIDGRWRNICDPVMQRAWERELKSGVSDLLSAGGKVGLLTSPHYLATGDEGTLWVNCLNRVITRVAKASPRVFLIDLDAWLCPAGRCRESQDGKKLRIDALHFGGPGGDIVARFVIEQLRTR